MNVKKILSIMLICLTLLSFASCGEKNNAQEITTEQGSADSSENTSGAADTTEKPEIAYYVRFRTDGYYLDRKPEYLKYSDLDAAKRYCDENAAYGCAVCDKEGNWLYSSIGEPASEILYQAKLVCDFIRDDGFTYGNAPINPAFDWSAHIVSCDRLVDWVLYRVGFTDQPYQSGKCVSGPWLGDWCRDQGFQKITKLEDVKAGDIVFVNPNSNGDPLHVFICAGGSDGQYLRYDAGSDTRIQSTQPSREAINNFIYAYRATAMPAHSGVEYAEITEVPKFNPDEKFIAYFTDDFEGPLRWGVLHDISGISVTRGELKLTCGGGDPYIVFNGSLNIACADADTLRVRIKNGTSSNVFQVFFITDGTPDYCAEAMVSVKLVQTRVKDFTEAEWEELEIDMSSCELWKGTLKGLRIDPVAWKGDVRIDSVSLGKISE